MRITIAKLGKGQYSVYLKRTRREETRVSAEENVPQAQVTAAIDSMVKKARGLPVQ